MPDIIKIIERIKTLKNIKPDSAVAEVLGMNQSTFAERKRKSSIPYEELADFGQRENVSFHWLIFGEGPMRRGELAVPERVAEVPAEYHRADLVDPQRREAAALIMLASDEDVGLVLRLLKHRAEGREIKKLFKEEG